MTTLKNKLDKSFNSYNKNLVQWLKADPSTTTFNVVSTDGTRATQQKINSAIKNTEVKKGSTFTCKAKDTQGKIKIERLMHNPEYGHYLESNLITTFKIVANKLIIG